MTDEEIAEFLAKSHAELMATFTDALQLGRAPHAPTGRPLVERCEVVRREVATCEVVK